MLLREELLPSLEDIREKLSLLIPTYELPLPAFSAKKKDGKRLYQLARK
jgi:tRNA U55 pseudouridine synthase TruB